MASLTAGDIRITWSIPLDNGGTPVVGYKIYLNQALLVDASDLSTLNQYTFTGLSVGQTYKMSVTAINAIGES